MRQPSLLSLLAACCVLAAATPALAQTTGIPNGLSGPGGTETFSPAPSMPSATPGGMVGAPALGVQTSRPSTSRGVRRVRRTAPSGRKP